MTMPTNKLRGRLAKRNGFNFEANVESACRQDRVALVRIPDGCRQVYRGGRTALIRVFSPFDYCAVLQGRVIFFDAKTTSDGAFGRSKITPHQLESLLETEQAGCTSGYLVRFTEHERCAFFTASKLASLKPRESLKPEDGIDCGPDFRPSLLPVFTGSPASADRSATPSP